MLCVATYRHKMCRTPNFSEPAAGGREAADRALPRPRQAEQAHAPFALAAREVLSRPPVLLEAERSWLAVRVRVPGDEQDRLQEDPRRPPGGARPFPDHGGAGPRHPVVDGRGDPNTPTGLRRGGPGALPGGLQAEAGRQAGSGRGYAVMPLEGLWRAEDMDALTRSRDKSRWDRALMAMVPDRSAQDVSAGVVERARTSTGSAAAPPGPTGVAAARSGPEPAPLPPGRLLCLGAPDHVSTESGTQGVRPRVTATSA